MGFQDQVAALAPPSAWGSVQQRAVQRAEEPNAVHRDASHGISGGGASVPHLDAIQRLATPAEPKAAAESDAPSARKSSDAREAPVGAQPGPHAFSVAEPGAWLLEVCGRDSAFDQRIVVHGAAAALDSESAPPVGQPIQVDAKGPWSLSIEHRVRPEQAGWAKGKPVGQWLGSTHKAMSQGQDFFDVGSEDFRDMDFNDLVVSGARNSVPEDDGGAYLVSSETSVEGAVARYDLIVGAAATGRLDVVLDLAMIGPEQLHGRDAEMLSALVERLGLVRGMVQSSPEVAAARVSLLEQLAGWETAARAALIEARQAGAAAEGAKNDETLAKGAGKGK